MHGIKWIVLLLMISTSTAMLNSSEVLSSCTYCQSMACRCPSQSKILNCSSYLLNLTFASNCAEPMRWDIVDFSSRNLESLDSSKLLSLKTARLFLKSNLISDIHDHTFDSLGDTLLELDLQMNQLSNLSSKWLTSKLIQLQILNLASNQLDSFLSLENIVLPNLQELNLSCNQIETFPTKIHQWTSLIKLDLSSNKLSTVPRHALRDLRQLTWLSLASNRKLSCITQDSFKQLTSLKYLDLSSTNLYHLDGCILTPLTSLQTLKIERVPINCSSCWLAVAKNNSIQLFGQCYNNVSIERLDSLTNKQLSSSCSQSSIDCSSDYCEPSSFDLQEKNFRSERITDSSDSSNGSKNRTVEIVLGVVFSILGLLAIIVIISLIYRWKQGKELFCCKYLSLKPSAINESTQRYHRQHQKRFIDSDPNIIESVVTHGTNLNIPAYPHDNDSPPNNEPISNTKRKQYNPMFTGTSPSDNKQSRTTMVDTR